MGSSPTESRLPARLDEARSAIRWFARRARCAMPGELRWQISQIVRRRIWERSAPRNSAWTHSRGARRFTTPLTLSRKALEHFVGPAIDNAERILQGRSRLLSVDRSDLARPVWNEDGRVDSERPTDLGDSAPVDAPSMKLIWELSRGGVETQLASAYWLTGDERYAERCAVLLTDWWKKNPPVHGPLWSSGVELGLRLISWAWTRRLLDDWPGAPALFEENPDALRHIYLHQDCLLRFPSRFSSANNHAVAEAAGLLVASCAFPWFDASAGFREAALARLTTQLDLQVTACGIQREQAIDYHCFVLDLALVALAEARAARLTPPHAEVEILERMADALALISDERGVGPRFGDSDDSHVLRAAVAIDIPSQRTLALSASCLGRTLGWPYVEPDLRAVFVGSLFDRQSTKAREPTTSALFIARDAGIVVMRERTHDDQPIYCAVRSGTMGYTTIRAHAHADMAAFELRIAGTDVVVDPGTYAYGELPKWRDFLRSTSAHSTLVIDDTQQATSWGPFIWHEPPSATVVIESDSLRDCTVAHSGYQRLENPATHRRRFVLRPTGLLLEDEVIRSTPSNVQSLFLLSPRASAVTQIEPFRFEFRTGDHIVDINVDSQLEWELEFGHPSGRGWVAPRFGALVPTWAIVGRGEVRSNAVLASSFDFRA